MRGSVRYPAEADRRPKGRERPQQAGNGRFPGFPSGPSKVRSSPKSARWLLRAEPSDLPGVCRCLALRIGWNQVLRQKIDEDPNLCRKVLLLRIDGVDVRGGQLVVVKD